MYVLHVHSSLTRRRTYVRFSVRVARQYPPMKRRFLQQCLAQGMSLEAIGEAVGRHPSTVSYWLKKHGLVANKANRHAPKGSLTKEQLVSLIESGLTLREIAARLDRSPTTIRYWMKRYELRTARRSGEVPPERPKRAELNCRRHGPTQFVLEGRGYYRCVKCRAGAVAKRRQVVKRTLVTEAGGRCAICGYSRCQQALHFHHLDPAMKKFHLGHKGQSRALARSRQEAQKCILLCGNCHAEVEAGLVELPVDFRSKVCSE